jgi:hypothetical protein
MSLVLAPCGALAAEPRPDQPHWSLELKGGALVPDIANWSTYYGHSYMGEYGGALSYKLLRQVEVGAEGSYASATGKGLLPVHATTSSGSSDVTFTRIPLNLFVLARGVFHEDQQLVPYAGGGYTRMFYRAEVKDQEKVQGSVGGYHARAGVQLLLDGSESDASDALYADYGIHHSYFFLEGKYTRAMADSTAGSVNLGGTSYLGGFLFEF